MLGVVRYPYLPRDVDRDMQEVAADIGRAERFNKAPVGVYFGSPGVEATIRTSAASVRDAPAASPAASATSAAATTQRTS
jgi:hypothetical protein